jgi:hypothetical protein
MKRLALSILIALVTGNKNAWLFWRAYAVAEDQTAKATDLFYYGNVKHNICYERVRTLLQKEGVDKDNLKGAVVHLAVAIAYLSQNK